MQKQSGMLLHAFGGIGSKYIIEYIIVIGLNDMYQPLIWESVNLPNYS
jgi:hypothetical protein